MSTTVTERKIAETELLRLEDRYWRAIQERDVDKALEMTDDPCLVAGASGVARVGREAFVEIMKGARYTLHAFELKKTDVRFLSDDVALVVYEVHEDLTVSGEKVNLDASDASVWVRREGRWLCALHTESVRGDPYGRDRSAPGNTP
jgi:uncharacterized protein (TIGR02246 family)